MSETSNPEHPGRQSKGAVAAATRWGEIHPEDDLPHMPPASVPEVAPFVPNRHSAAAEAASLRWHESHEGYGYEEPE